MSLSKQFLKSKPVCKVTFSLEAENANGAKTVAVLGEFNDWDSSATPLKKQKDGSFKGTVELDAGKEFQFRYLVDGETWLNDVQADKFVASGISTDQNSVLVL
ncbi:isoamylase early set domain-containing protein [Siphonobacter aquaeclarae]|jgi:1,4-alpha-glucan branching enzyme|uniref:Glycogen recognition site of AMP-activated protein kinase n=1 Tax=Siphonobacter aquaeclarae TaxID=563176 RepID=A0A1G9NKE5_9BACT|nr:isoamylase early set domain-containing protein [Siphonobacter aquaeclarae]MBO9636634.1 isoamylase early set domain-containing protein [Siphonobacter aquaeclarae]SDL86840.1 Glycogen recognition site of AMP-activated protein kinase [Siphonobacter aquaeclarae]